MTLVSPSEETSTVWRGIGLFVLSVFLLATMDTTIKWVSGTFPTIQIVLFRAAFALIPIAILVHWSGGLASLRARRPGMLLLRGLVGLGAAFSFFMAFAHMPLADAYAIAFAAPIVITALSVPMLGETVGWRRWTAVAVGFIGVLIILRPGGGSQGLLGFGALMAMIGMFLYSLAAVMIRQMTRTETNAAILIYQIGVMVCGSAIFMPWYFVMPGWGDLGLLAMIGILGGLGSLAMTQAFRLTQVSILAPFEYTAMIWGVGFGYALWGDLPDLWVWAGTAVVVASGLYILRRETQRRSPTAAPPLARPATSGPALSTPPEER